ncbi:F-box/LRR-repeat protein 12 [Pterocles gutturalis]
MAAMGGEELPVLPDSVLLRVLELLPLRDRLRAARVSRRWQRLALDRTVWRDVDLSPHRLTSHTLWQLVRQRLSDSLRTLRLRGALCSGSGSRRFLSPALLTALAKRCPCLRRLILTELDLRPIPYESIPPSLTTLELSCCEIPAAWFTTAALPQLQHLVVRTVPAFSDFHLFNISSRCRLKTLNLSGTYRLTDSGIQKAAPQLDELEFLTLRHCDIGDSAAGFIGRYMKRLRFLEITNTKPLEYSG